LKVPPSSSLRLQVKRTLIIPSKVEHPCFFKVTGSKTLELADYDGNRMYRSLGNIGRNPLVGILFSVSMGTSTTVIWRDCGSMGVPRSMIRLMRSNTCQAPDALYRFAFSIFFQTARATFKQWN
jgi:hypothetical protein